MDIVHFFMGGPVGHGAGVELCQVAGEPCVWCNGAVCHNNGTNRCEVYDVQVHGKGKVPGTDAFSPRRNPFGTKPLADDQISKRNIYHEVGC